MKAVIGRTGLLAAWPLVLMLLTAATAQTPGRTISKADLSALRAILRDTHDDLVKYYYDSKFGGFDLDARFKEAETKLESAESMNYAVADIAGAVNALNDSHTVFLPPPHAEVLEYGWRMQPIGETDCFIIAVRAGSDAEKKGLKPGDRVLSVNGYAAIREDYWKINYVYRTLRPQPGLRLAVAAPDGKERQVDVMGIGHPRTQNPWQLADEAERMWKEHRPRYKEYGRVLVMRLPDFMFEPENADEMLNRIRSYDSLVLDLRGNPGGRVDFLSRLLGGMFDHEVTIASPRGRKPMPPTIAKSRGGKAFSGKLVVLIDSRSASAAELFARVMQLEKRAVVVGDRSSGMVMEARIHPHQRLVQGGAFNFAVSVTEADMVMSDGKSLEKSGVLPDERVTPTALDLAAARDPALSRALALTGVDLTSEDAGKGFPVEWPN